MLGFTQAITRLKSGGGWVASSRVSRGRICFQAHPYYWQDFVPCCCGTGALISLMALILALSQFLEATHIPHHMILSIFRSVIVHQILLLLHIWFSSFLARESSVLKGSCDEVRPTRRILYVPYSTKTTPFTLLGIMQGMDTRGVVHLGGYLKIVPTQHI